MPSRSDDHRPRPRATGRVTLDDVAREAGVSRITASRALRGQRSVDPSLARRVRDAAQRLGYVPDPAARALASARSSHVIVLVPLLSNTLFVDLLEAVQATLMPAGFQTLIGITHYDRDEEEQLLRSYMAHRPAGLLVTGFDRSEASRRLIAASGVPCVHLMETTDAAGVYSVGFSQTAAGRAITEHLLARRRQRIAFVAAQLDPRVMQRAEGYRQALRAAGLYDARRELLNPQCSSIALGAQLFEQLMAQQPDTDGVFFCNDDLAQGGLLAALRLGVKVPHKVAVAGFNDLPGSDQMWPPLTTVHTPRREIGAAAAGMLLALMRGEPVAKPCVDVGYSIVVRGST
ncbi:substrate-binding domain-containing protein [Calidifontimicrobium sp. SYSU G02091]|uniref:substrate-binding domain-containing protein n=1 Tax=Calidifontimicrobium sp. SYSU G02091 TaxID=2926421 RepID=UPI001F53C575|nr:substrate-binding domain-containing protein [Calidifontimicrobium sp. SYSU G02091]MCI1191817.1 substrate-binding domain-containing protein [Calidifontimicrobium sp. SYSU G02091]